MKMGRPARNLEVTAERRRRNAGSLDAMLNLKLSVPPDHNDPAFAYRWINDDGNRMHAKTVLDDWDKDPKIQPIPVGTNAEGKPILAHYCRKPKAFLEQDHQAHMDLLAERERGLVADKKSDPNDTRTEGESYVVPGNSISKRAYSP